jgi:hypothetical protein
MSIDTRGGGRNGALCLGYPRIITAFFGARKKDILHFLLRNSYHYHDQGTITNKPRASGRLDMGRIIPYRRQATRLFETHHLLFLSLSNENCQLEPLFRPTDALFLGYFLIWGGCLTYNVN